MKLFPNFIRHHLITPTNTILLPQPRCDMSSLPPVGICIVLLLAMFVCYPFVHLFYSVAMSLSAPMSLIFKLRSQISDLQFNFNDECVFRQQLLVVFKQSWQAARSEPAQPVTAFGR